MNFSFKQKYLFPVSLESAVVTYLDCEHYIFLHSTCETKYQIISLENNKCIMYGNFCSPSCAAAFNFDTNLDSNVFERYSLLNHVYNNSEPVFIANSKLLINTWGGIYSIDEYRRLNKNFKRVNVEVYPFVATIPTLEETSYDLDITKPINFDKDKLKKVSAEYKLKRSKPLPDHKNTLESCMNLKFV